MTPDDALQSASSEPVFVDENLASSRFLWLHKNRNKVNLSREQPKKQ